MLLFSALVAGSFALGVRVANDIAPTALTAVRFWLAAGLIGVVVLASGGLSHRFWPLRQFRDHEAADPDLHIRTPEAAAADRHVIDRLLHGDHAAVLDFVPEFRSHASQGFFGHYLSMLGAIGGGD